VHLARRLAAEAREDAIAHVAFLGLLRLGRTAGCPAARTARRFVLQTLAGVELLLAGGENERDAAVLADDFLVYVCQLV